MNKTYRLVWNELANAWIAVSEITKGCGKGSSKALLISAVAAGLSAPAFAQTAPPPNTLPTRGQVIAGAAAISSTANTMTVQQTSQRAAINWQSFSVGSNATVNFQQPNASAVILNRVIGNETSVIAGALNANGQVFLLNSNGVLFTKGASVNTGGLVASTLNIADADFMAGRNTFTANGSKASVINLGTITAAEGGYVALLGNQVKNEGVITARLGTAVMAAGDRVSLNFNGDSLVGVTIDQGTLNALVENKQAIRADGGLVVLTAKGLDTVMATVVNNTGEVRAQTVATREGKIYLLGGMENDRIEVGGTLDASAPNGGHGGFVETSAARVKFANDVAVTTHAVNGTTGTWLIDPLDFTIAAGGGESTTSGIGATTLSSNLGSGNVSIATAASTAGNGDIFVNSAVSWSANKLTLSAHRNININANLNASSGASLALIFGQGAVAAGNTSQITTTGAAVNLPAGTSNFTTRQGSDGVVKTYTVITTLGAAGSTTAADLQGMNGNQTLNYALGSNINAAATNGWNSNAGFTPIGDNSTPFTGTFDGLGHTISSLTINRSTTSYVGLFGYTADTGSTIRNVGLVGGSVRGQHRVGGLVGRNGGGTISNSYATGAVHGSFYVGGLVGFNVGGTISNSYVTGAVTGSLNVGGLVGRNDGGTISNSYATGEVNGTSHSVGGLVGWNGGSGNVSSSYATGAVTGNESVGGLVGNNESNISNSYATGAVTGTGTSWSVGGLVGYHYGRTISNSYATGNVTGTGDNAGGLVGSNEGGTVRNSYATGAVTGIDYVGGLVGWNYDSEVNNSYATGAVTGTGTGNYVGGLVGYYDSGTVGNSYATGAITGQSNVGGLVGYNNFNTVTSSYWNTNNNASVAGIGGGSTDGATGRTTAQMMSMASFTGFNIADTPGSAATWRIYEGQTTPWLTSFLKPLTVTASSDSKNYDGVPYSGGNGVSYSVASPNPALSGVLAYSGTSQSAVNAGSYTLVASGLYSVQQGYDISYVNSTLTINNATPASTTSSTLANIIANAIIVPQSNQPQSTTPPGSFLASGGVATGTSQPSAFVSVTNPLPSIIEAFGPGVPFDVISSPGANEPTQAVTVSQMRSMTQVSAGGAVNVALDVRVPASRNSLAAIVNGGVMLPTGVEQQFFAVKANR